MTGKKITGLMSNADLSPQTYRKNLISSAMSSAVFRAVRMK
jgi:hypothetical protein